ncbi:MAG: hypothetical protein ACYS22_04900 [Planctomycetota bacterium]
MTGWIGAGLLGLTLLSGAASAGLIIELQTNGLPGTERGAVLPQHMTVGLDSLVLRPKDVEGARFTIVRLDKEVVWEFDPATKTHTERTFASLRREREQAELDREAARLKAIERLEGDELNTWLKLKGLRRDGRRIASVERRPAKVGRYNTTLHTIKLNGKTYLEIWATAEIEGYEPPKELFDFYDKGGLFPDEVMRELRKVQGFPVRTRANLDYFSAGTTLETEVTAVMEHTPVPADVAVPEGYKLVDRFPRVQTQADLGACPVCGEKIEKPLKAPASRLHVCSNACLIKFARNPRKYQNK